MVLLIPTAAAGAGGTLGCYNTELSSGDLSPSCAFGSLFQTSELKRRSGSRGAPAYTAFWRQPTFSGYIPQQSSFWTFWGEAAARGHCGSNCSLWWAHVAVGPAQTPAFLRQGWNPRDDGPLQSMTSWSNKGCPEISHAFELGPRDEGGFPCLSATYVRRANPPSWASLSGKIEIICRCCVDRCGWAISLLGALFKYSRTAFHGKDLRAF